MKQRFINSSMMFIALAVPAALFIGTLAGYILKAINPSNVDVTAGLAYLGQSLYAGFGALALFLSLGIISALMGVKQGQIKQLKATVLAIVIILICVIGSVIAQRLTDKVEKNYSKQQVQNLYQQLRINPKK